MGIPRGGGGGAFAVTVRAGGAIESGSGERRSISGSAGGGATRSDGALVVDARGTGASGAAIEGPGAVETAFAAGGAAVVATGGGEAVVVAGGGAAEAMGEGAAVVVAGGGAAVVTGGGAAVVRGGGVAVVAGGFALGGGGTSDAREAANFESSRPRSSRPASKASSTAFRSHFMASVCSPRDHIEAPTSSAVTTSSGSASSGSG